MKSNRQTIKSNNFVNILAAVAIGLCTLGAGVQAAQAQDPQPTSGPVILQGDMVNVRMSENGSPRPFDLTLSAADPDGVDGLIWSIHTPPAHGTAEADTVGEFVYVNYIPESDYVGEDIFAVRVTAADGEEDVIIVVVRVEEAVFPEAAADEPVSALAGSPYIRLDSAYNSIYGDDWPAGTLLTLTIDDMSNGVGVDYTTTATAQDLTSYTEACFDSPPFSLNRSDIISVSGGGVTKTLTVSLQFEGVSLSENTVYGIANPGDVIAVSVYKMTYGYVTLTVTTDSSGAWVADYDTTGYTIYRGDDGRATFTDADGDVSLYTFFAPMIYSSVTMNQSVYSSGWQTDLPLTVTIDDSTNGSGVDYTASVTAIEDSGGFGYFYLYPDTSLLSDYDTVRITNGSSTETFEVFPVSITNVNVDEDTISGTASSIYDVVAYACNGSICTSRYLYMPGGSWNADFSVAGINDSEVILDITSDYYVAASQSDTSLHTTRVSQRSSISTPVLSTISPLTVQRGQGEFTLTVNGSNYSRDSQIMWDTSPLQTIYVSSTQLTATIPASLTNSTDAAYITVYTPGLVNSLSVRFSVTSFYDVPGTSSIWRWVEGLYAQGITGGCANTPLRYCPNNAVTRTQMAVFLLRAMNSGSYTPPTDLTNVFSDVPTAGNEWAQNWINQFYLSGITSGCSTSPLNYCPDNSVTRAQMAIFLLRAEHGSSYTPPAASGIFADLPLPANASIAAWVEQLYNEGITSGCSTDPLNYCPNSPVTRAQMAIFIDRTFEFDLEPEVLLE